MTTDTEYQVYCEECDAMWNPQIRSPLWWKAHKHAQRGYIDAFCASPIEHGCEQAQVDPDAPFRVSGYTDDLHDFDRPFHLFTDAMRYFRDKVKCGGAVFISGVSRKVEDRLRLGT